MNQPTRKVLDHGYVTLHNLAGPVRRPDALFDAHDRDPANCARMSFDAQHTKSEAEDTKLNNYLYKHKHTTPFEMIVVWLEMKMPLFIARQFVRHRTVSINEVSARYTKLPNEFYIPVPSVVGVKSKSNKQGRTVGGEPNKTTRAFISVLGDHSASAYAKYEVALGAGIPPELARCFLPVNIYTKWIWKQDLHNMLHFLRLRLDGHAQYEAREYAQAIKSLLVEQLPSVEGYLDGEKD